jgi:hypothetical protein
MRLENQSYSWQALMINAKNKEQAINRHLQLKNTVEINIKESAKPPHAQGHNSPRKNEQKHDESANPSRNVSPLSQQRTPVRQ